MGSGDGSISLDAPSTPGTYYYGACVDAVSGESDTTNNCSPAVTVTVGAAPAPDLVVDAPAVNIGTPAAGARFTLSATVRNQGDGSSAFTTLRYYQSTDSTITTGDTAVGTDSVFRLVALGSGDGSISLDAPSTPGTYYYGACVDAVSDESDTTNNCSAAVTVTVGAAPAPDLVVSVPNLGGSVPAAGEPFLLNNVVRDQGSAPSPRTTARYFLSTDSTITTDDTEIAAVSVNPLGAPGGYVTNINPTAPSTPGTYYYGVCVDSVRGESDTQNNCSPARTVTVSAAPQPDLVVNTPTVSESAPAAGARFTLNATVRNQGSGSADSTTLRYYQSTDPTITDGDTEVDTDSVGGLSAAESGDESISLTAPSTPSAYYYGACVDAVSDESDTTNNCSPAVTVTVGDATAPDLVVDTPTMSESALAPSGSFTLKTTVRNQGNGTLAFATLRYYQSTDSTITTGDTEVGTDSVARLDASDSGDESISLTAPSTPGTYYYGACVDAVSDESDTTNNCSAAVSVTIDAASAPDLVVDAPTVSDSTPTAGEKFRIVAAVRNQGNAASEPTTLRFYRSTDSTITTSDELVDSPIVMGLSPSETTYLTSDPRAPSTPGTYYYGACVVSVSNESNAGNNCSSALTIMAGQPDLVVDTPIVYLRRPFAGESFALETVVRNQGTSWSGFTTLRYYRSTDSTITSSDTSVDYAYLAPLSPSDSSSEETALPAPSTPGTYYYGACVETVAGESDTTNNCSAAVAVTVVAPDLVVDTPTVSDSTLTAGASFTLNVTVRNRGDATSPPTTLRYYRSTDSTVTSSDASVGSDWVSGVSGLLNASESSAESISLTAPTTAGTYYYGACVDAVTDESDTTNNCSVTVTVTVSPPAVTLRLTECFVIDGSHVAAFRVRARVSVSSLVVRTYAVDGRNNNKHLIATTNVGNLSAGSSYEKVTVKLFPSHLASWLTRCAVDASWE